MAAFSKPSARREGDRVEAPVQFAGLSVIGTQVAAHAVFTAGLADKHLPLRDARRARDGVVFALVDGQGGPDFLAIFRVDRDQATVERAQVDFSVIGSDAAVHDS